MDPHNKFPRAIKFRFQQNNYYPIGRRFLREPTVFDVYFGNVINMAEYNGLCMSLCYDSNADVNVIASFLIAASSTSAASRVDLSASHAVAMRKSSEGDR